MFMGKYWEDIYKIINEDLGLQTMLILSEEPIKVLINEFNFNTNQLSYVNGKNFAKEFEELLNKLSEEYEQVENITLDGNGNIKEDVITDDQTIPIEDVNEINDEIVIDEPLVQETTEEIDYTTLNNEDQIFNEEIETPSNNEENTTEEINDDVTGNQYEADDFDIIKFYQYMTYLTKIKIDLREDESDWLKDKEDTYTKYPEWKIQKLEELKETGSTIITNINVTNKEQFEAIEKSILQHAFSGKNKKKLTKLLYPEFEISDNPTQDYARLLVAKEKVFKSSKDKLVISLESEIKTNFTQYIESKGNSKETWNSELNLVAIEMNSLKNKNNKIYNVSRKLRSIPGIAITTGIGLAGLALLPVSLTAGSIMIGSYAVVKGVLGYMSADGMVTAGHRFFRQRFGKNDIYKAGASLIYNDGQATKHIIDQRMNKFQTLIVKTINKVNKIMGNDKIFSENIDNLTADVTDVTDGLVDYANKYRKFKIYKTIASVAVGISCAVISPGSLKNLSDGIKSAYTKIFHPTHVVENIGQTAVDSTTVMDSVTTRTPVNTPIDYSMIDKAFGPVDSTAVMDSVTTRMPVDSTTVMDSVTAGMPVNSTAVMDSVTTGMPVNTPIDYSMIDKAFGPVDSTTVMDSVTTGMPVDSATVMDSVTAGTPVDSTAVMDSVTAGTLSTATTIDPAITEIVVGKGGSFWTMATEAAKNTTDFSNLTDAQQLYVIDGIKDQMLINPTQFGIDATEMMKDSTGALTWVKQGATANLKEMTEMCTQMMSKAVNPINAKQVAQFATKAATRVA